MYYIGVDPSLTATGFVVLDEKGNLQEKKIIKSKLKDVERLIELSDELRDSLQTYRGKISGVCIEGYSFGSRLGQAFSIGELCGIFKICLTKFPVLYKIIAPTRLKKFVTGKGNSKKELLLKEVYKKWGIDFNDNNLADAYGLARISWSYENRKKLLSYEKEIIEQI